MSLEASQGAIRRRCAVCGRRIHGTNTSGLCQFHRATKDGGLCRSCPAVLTMANTTGYCVACWEQTDEQREAKRVIERERYRQQVDGKACQHCQIRKITRARGLCFRCSTDAAIRNLYPSRNKYARDPDAMDREDYEPSPCPEPTDALPGTRDKVAVLRERMAARVALWHEGDPRFTSDEQGDDDASDHDPEASEDADEG